MGMDTDVPSRLRTWIEEPLRAFGVTLALFGVLNIALGLLGGPDRNDIWVRGVGLPSLLRDAAILLFAIGVLVGPWRGAWIRSAGRVGALLLAAMCALDAAAFVALRADGRIEAATPLSLSAVLTLLLAGIAFLPATRMAAGWPRRVLRVGGVGAMAGCLVLLHLMTFGSTDYRRPADAAIVLGAAVRPTGKPSQALRDRTNTACDLYQAGLVRSLVFSGGHADGIPISEPTAMKQMALERGVPAHAIVLDEDGWTSDHTVRNTCKLARERQWGEVLLVSNDFHLARLHLLAKEHGLAARTVPADEPRGFPSKPLFYVREVLAWSWHFLRTAVTTPAAITAR